MKPLGLYLHIPFCKSKCGYCDFYSIPRPDAEAMQAYVDRLCEDLQANAHAAREYTVDTVYLGGGTPTLLPSASLARILETVQRFYRVDRNAEITAECNPATADREKLCEMRRAGYTRLSIGVQSAVEGELRALGRKHSWRDVQLLWEAATTAGFSNLSVDLMLGIPHQTMNSLQQTMDAVLSLSPKHLSAYTLSIEPNTPFGRVGEGGLDLPDEDGTTDLYLLLLETAERHGLHQYEISNFAEDGYESRHNLKYWNCEEYLGLGPAAHSDFGGVRWGNKRAVSEYLEKRPIREGEARISQEERLEEYVMLRMRLCQGLDMDILAARFGEAARERFETGLSRYCEGGFVKRKGESLAFTPKGMLVSNSILSELLDFGAQI